MIMKYEQKEIRDKILSNHKSDFRTVKLYAKNLNLFRNIFDKFWLNSRLILSLS